MSHQVKLLEVHSRTSLGVAITAAVTGIPLAQAQENSELTLEEVVVTATKRAQNQERLSADLLGTPPHPDILRQPKEITAGRLPQLVLGNRELTIRPWSVRLNFQNASVGRVQDVVQDRAALHGDDWIGRGNVLDLAFKSTRPKICNHGRASDPLSNQFGARS